MIRGAGSIVYLLLCVLYVHVLEAYCIGGHYSLMILCKNGTWEIWGVSLSAVKTVLFHCLFTMLQLPLWK